MLFGRFELRLVSIMIAQPSDLPTFSGLKRHGPFGVVEDTVPVYLFQTQFGYEVMIAIQREYAALNDYMVSLSEIEIPVSNSPEQAWRDYLKNTPYDPSDLDGISDMADVQFDLYEMSIDLHATTRIFHAAACATLIYFLLIRSLKEIIKACSYRDVKASYEEFGIDVEPSEVKTGTPGAGLIPDIRDRYRAEVMRNFREYQRLGGNEFNQCLSMLKDRCGVDMTNAIKPNREFLDLLERMRTARNDFAHGKWDRIELVLSKFKAKDAFEKSSWLLKRIEKKLPKKRDSFFCVRVSRF